jgi:hypothetical protein
MCTSFISKLEDELSKIEIFNDEVDDDYLNSKEGLEKLILKPLHQSFFTIDPKDKTIDDELALKIARIAPLISLHNHLHGPEEFTDDTLVELAIQEFQRIDSYRAPRDKLQCILNGFRVIRHALDTVIGQSKWGADQLLPLCIYSIIKANPPSLQSNVNFISRFRHPTRLRGEDEYLLMQMDIAIKDILSIDELLLKAPIDLTIQDLVLMWTRFDKCITELDATRSISQSPKPPISPPLVQSTTVTTDLLDVEPIQSPAIHDLSTLSDVGISGLIATWRQQQWKLTDIKNFIHAYQRVTEEYARVVGPIDSRVSSPVITAPPSGISSAFSSFRLA